MKIFKLKNPKRFIKVFAALAFTNIFFYFLTSTPETKKETSNTVEIVLLAKSFTPTTPQKEVLIYDPETRSMIGSAIIMNDESPGEEIKKIQLSLTEQVARKIISQVGHTTFHLYPRISDLKIHSSNKITKKDPRYEIIF